ncbi:uncharacterized protein BYT42DRAFT_213372 [Radiomyces spectabilis]|uniref:uncharacterized protein n=1 Tax=Radiomyces spectabilis TaxID=64574 RepID=UPI00221F95CD|nr:uncharacterized protein BYT42DRAFT_213372 [Radiomyces spectabilis]KAI8364370.1 hypothetical protein BYT42DRAFT_213372 [Radiomyces spectabilis]
MVAPMPDIVVKKDGTERLAGEFKGPHSTSVGVHTDLVKLGNELKFMLGSMVRNDPSENVYVVGILLQGFRCTTYKLDLIYNGVYRLIELSSANLMINGLDFFPAIKVFENMAQLKNLIITPNHHAKQPLSWRRPSFFPPIDISV